MTLRDKITMATGNLWRMKLRAFLTISGVIIAIAAFVAMLSFGAGMQENISREFDQLGLFSTIHVFPQREEDGKVDTTGPSILDDAAVQMLADIPGVAVAYPFDDFDVTVQWGDSTIKTTAQALPTAAVGTKLYSRMLAGSAFDSDSSRQVLVTDSLLTLLHIENPDSLVGQRLILSVMQPTVDSAVISVFKDADGKVRRRLRDIKYDSLLDPAYLRQTLRTELSDALRRFVDGYINARAKVSDTFVVSGVLKSQEHGRQRTQQVVVPMAAAGTFSSGGLPADPSDLLVAVESGTLFNSLDNRSNKNYPRVTLSLAEMANNKLVGDSVRALGFRTFSYAEQFEEIRRAFLYLDLVLGVVGLIALITASLGIVNTMVMSIIERKREIGVLKSLGCDERDIKLLFLFESGLIGAIGATVGIIFGYIITRIASLVVRMIMEKQGVDAVELFALPIWLIAIAFVFGLTVSVLAGFYPASRAARIDPVEALRND